VLPPATGPTPRIKSGLVVFLWVALLANFVVCRRLLAALMFAILARGHSWLAAFLLVISPNEGWPSDQCDREENRGYRLARFHICPAVCGCPGEIRALPRTIRPGCREFHARVTTLPAETFCLAGRIEHRQASRSLQFPQQASCLPEGRVTTCEGGSGMQNCPPYSPMIHDNANSVVTSKGHMR